MDLLYAGSGASSSTLPPATTAQGTLYQECEALRRWLNGFYEGNLETLDEAMGGGVSEDGNGPDNYQVEEEGDEAARADDEEVLVAEEEGREEEDDMVQVEVEESAPEAEDDMVQVEYGGTDEEYDDAALVQRSQGVGRGPEARSRSSPRPPRRARPEEGTWSVASARGWETSPAARGDNNAHGPWRRPPSAERPSTKTAESSDRGARTGGSAARAGGPVRRCSSTSHRRELPEAWEEHTWHILLDMVDAMSNPASMAYGLTADGMANVQAS